ncbi:long-chain-fatty-acid--CoA ligase ACSBG2 [Penaeus vannamei]|uniref:long-chain-fatty-acid--CoA ligase ACSBG2 n=1 Tax=Penaeus vannamei TaxID=6689 RepID=UPI000F690B91|nr:long-chain-fatty-acid--CoA ligase ACSBG2-like [Penaeus vannamei]XP_027222041.1 long-chain-fatty-acid--CoA ligase ACSBG2-like [Penaeus vannamei]XP_027222042.1 long-chain-fatty-acid--CoA ligase ACSBG2-like [Penaeus vannamei]
MEENFDEYRNGPDQVLPATHNKTWEADGVVKLYIEEEGAMAGAPFSVHTLMQDRARDYAKHPALAVKREGAWRYWTYKEYFEESRTVAKAFIRLGLERFHGVCIMGFNSPEWLIANFGCIFAGGLCAGVYTTNSPEACRHLAENCRAQIIVVEDNACLNKFLAVKRFLPEIKAIIQWSGVPGAPGVISWAELMAIGLAEKDAELEDRLSLAAVNQCCTLIYTSGTTGPPKGVMCSQDHLTWGSSQYQANTNHELCTEVFVSYLPLSHLAAQMLDVYLACTIGATVYFAQPDALKGTLGQTLQEVRPTCFLGVPRVWEKIYERMQEAGAQVGGVKKAVATWAKYHGLNYFNALRDGRTLSTYERACNSLAKALILNKVKAAIGFNRAEKFVSGAAPISKDVLEYFMSINIPIMEGYGMSESLSICSMSYPEQDRFRLGSVGKALPQCYTKLAPVDGCKPDEGEICMKGRSVFMGYLHMPEKTSETIDDEGWLHSGDIGRFDEDGFLYITGRIKELIITAGGENIPPVLIEEAVKKELPFVSFAFLCGDRRKYLSMLLTLKAETDDTTGEPQQILTPACQALFKDLGCDVQTVAEAVAEVKENPSGPLAKAIQDGIERYNKSGAVSNAQKIQKWALLPLDFSQPTGELNNTLKLKRSFVQEKYKDIIDSMYIPNKSLDVASKL